MSFRVALWGVITISVVRLLLFTSSVWQLQTRPDTLRNGPHETKEQKLNKEAQERYLQKNEEINGINPYDHKKWTEDLQQILEVTLPDVFVYQVCGVSAYTYEQFMNYKSSETRVQFSSCVQAPQIIRVNHQKALVCTKVRNHFLLHHFLHEHARLCLQLRPF